MFIYFFEFIAKIALQMQIEKVKQKCRKQMRIYVTDSVEAITLIKDSDTLQKSKL